MSKQKQIDEYSGVELTGHEWDGIAELNTPMPRWWLGIFYSSIVIAILYMIFMPAIPALPGMQGYTKGVWGRSDRDIVAEKITQMHADRAVFSEQLKNANLETFNTNDDLLSFALAQGESLFGDNCATCHGSAGQGSTGYPNLNDNFWLWGGHFDEIKQTITHGIRANDDDTHYSIMAAYGKDEILTNAEINDLVQFVLDISSKEGDERKPTDKAAIARGAALFADNCTACHGEDAQGTRENGAPNLTDYDWLYGGDAKTIRQTITNGRQGLMPNWNQRLTEEQITALTMYVYSKGGGE